MENEQNGLKTLDHLPTPAELQALYESAAENDPRSPYYKRVLNRPCLPVARIVIFLLSVSALGFLAGVGTYYIAERVLLALLSAAGVWLCAGLLFAKPLVIHAVLIYQRFAPASLRNRCRYEPSCSAYMLLAIEKYGILRGLKKGIARWRSCKVPNGGFDEP